LVNFFLTFRNIFWAPGVYASGSRIEFPILSHLLIRGITFVVRVFVAMRNLLGDSWLVAAVLLSGDDITGEVQSPIFKIQGLAIIDCTRQWPCWRHYFMSADFLQGEILWSMIQRDSACAFFPFWKRRYSRSRTSGVILGCLYYCYKE
jgi:hypothetical protein